MYLQTYILVMLFSRVVVIAITLFFTVRTSGNLCAQAKLPVDEATGKISYKFSVEFDKAYTKQAVYDVVRDWLNSNPETFNRFNTPLVHSQNDTRKNENREAVLREFQNPNPLQFMDPESDRVSGKVILRYTGGANGCIRLFYIQYAIVMWAEGNTLKGEICNIRYNHFNPRTYQVQPVFNWSGMMPCDENNTLEYLKDCEACHAEFSSFYSFLNNDMQALIGALKDYIKTERGVAVN